MTSRRHGQRLARSVRRRNRKTWSTGWRPGWWSAERGYRFACWRTRRGPLTEAEHRQVADVSALVEKHAAEIARLA